MILEKIPTTRNTKDSDVFVINHSISHLLFGVFVNCLVIWAILFPHTIFASLVVNTRTYVDTSLNSGLVGYWTFDSKNLKDNVTDSSGGGNNGYLNSFGATSTAVVIGELGQGLKVFNYNSYVKVSAPASFSGMATVSLSLWFNPSDNNSGGSNYFFNLRNTVSPFNIYNITYDATSKRIATTVFNSSGIANSPGCISNIGSISTNKWQHIIVTYDGTSVKLYINGTQNACSGSLLSGNVATQSAGASLYLFSNSGVAGSSFNGSLDDIRIYNRALSASEVKQLYNVGAGSKVNATQTSSSSGLVGYWTFDSKNLKDNVTDSSGNGNNGYLFAPAGTSTIVVPGKIGQAFKPNPNNLDYIGVSDSTSLRDLPEGSYSVAFWVNGKGVNIGGADYFIHKATGSSSNGWLISITVNNVVDWQIKRATTNQRLFRGSGQDFSKGWQHVVLVKGPGTTAADLSLYVNGQFVNSGTTDGVGAYQSDSGIAMRIGKSNFSGYYGEALDDIRIYNRALSASEVKQLYNVGAGSKVNATQTSSSSGLVGYWTFDSKNLKDNVTDSSGNGNNGTLQNFGATSTAVVAGKVGQGLKFDGVDDYIQTNNELIGAGPTTLSVWIYPRSFGSGTGSRIFTNGKTSVRITSTGNKLQSTNIAFGGTSPSSASSDNNSIVLNKWQMVTAVRVNNNAWTLYIDGIQNGSANQSQYADAAAGTFGLRLSDYSTSLFDGYMDDARIYSRALSASEIKQLYNMGR